MKSYVVNGRVAREEIAADICDGVLKRSDVKKLISDPQVRDAFIGDSFHGKIDKTGWNRKYLNNLPNVAVAESFNEDYLLYLADVSDYVEHNGAKEGKSIFSNKWFWIALGAVAVAAVVIAIMVGMHSTPTPNQQP